MRQPDLAAEPGAFETAFAERIHSLTEGTPSFALLLGDVDHFNRINDTRGHVESDAVLRRVAQVLQARPAPATLCSAMRREVALILSDANLDTAVAVSERLRLAMAAAFWRSANGGPAVTVTFGLALCDTPIPRVADRALYDAKASGRNRLVVGTV